MKSFVHNLRFNPLTIGLLAFVVALAGFFLVLAKSAAVVTAVAYLNISQSVKGRSCGFAPVAVGANTLTGLIPTIYEALDIVSRELVGFIPSVTRDSTVERAAVGQTVTSHIAPASTASDLTPGVTAPNDGDQVIGSTTLTITKARGVPIRWTGEEQRGLNNNGAGYNPILRDQFAQGMRTLTNEIELDLAVAARNGASRAWGTAGTAPFASDLSDTANILKILKDNGCPESELKMVINTTSGAKVRTLTQLTKANEANDDTMLRQGTLLDIHGFAFKESAKLGLFTKGTATGQLVNGALAVGATAIVTDGGSGTVLPGDVITFAGDTNKYVVQSSVGGSTVTLITIGGPGLVNAVADNVAITVGGNYTPNIGFHRSSLILAARAPALPVEGDMAADRMTITDPRSGLNFEVSLYKQYRQIRYEIAMAWGVKALKSDFIATLLG